MVVFLVTGCATGQGVPSGAATPTSTPTPTAAASAAVPEFPGVSDDVALGTYVPAPALTAKRHVGLVVNGGTGQ
jgi:hypothetical protein